MPCLALTFMLGPVGLLLYLVLRGVVKKKIWVEEDEKQEAGARG